MALIIVDLDNTLLDRVAAFRRWAENFLASFSLEVELLDKLEKLDQDGIRLRSEFFHLVAQACEGVTVADVQSDYLGRYPSCFELEAETAAALTSLRQAGHVVGIATNGPPFQNDVIEQSGLARLVDGWAVSELVGYRKPAAEIARILAETVGQPIQGSVVVGDGLADMQLAYNLDVASVWITRHREWFDEVEFRPMKMILSAPEALQWTLSYLTDAT